MKLLLTKLFAVPFVAYFFTMFTVAIIGSTNKSFIRETLDNNALPVWIVWIGISVVIVVVHHFLKRDKE